MLQSYYNILEIKRDASPEEIKIAFRKRAKELHPDRNYSPDAHEQFVLLNEAYQYLIRTKRSKEPVRNTERQRNHRRARQYASMNYDKFVKTDYYKSIDSVNNIFDYFYLIFGILFLIAIPLGLTLAFGFWGFIIGLVPLLISAKFIQLGFKNANLVSRSELWESIIHVLTRVRFQIFVLTIINLYLMFTYGFSAMIRSYFIMILYLGIPIGIYSLIKKVPKSNLWSFGLLPLMINVFFILNFSLSKNPSLEVYHFKSVQHQISTSSEPNTVLVLDNDVFSEYFHYRFIWDFDKLRFKDYIAYHFEEGFFGITVLKDYQLYNEIQIKQRGLTPIQK